METGLVKHTKFIPMPQGSNSTPSGGGLPQGGNTVSTGGNTGRHHQDERRARAEYLLVVYPYGDLQDRLLEEQQQFSSDYGLQMTVRNKPHITLAAFQAGEEMEDTLIRWIQRICTQHNDFQITLNNYSGIPPHTPKPPPAACPQGQTLALYRECANFSQERIPGTIYLRVQDPQPFRELMQQLKTIDDFIRSSGGTAVNLASRPYLSIAGGLTEQVYNRAMPDYSRKTFHGIFQVGELVLLKRGHSFDACKTVNIFRLLPGRGQPGPSQA